VAAGLLVWLTARSLTENMAQGRVLPMYVPSVFLGSLDKMVWTLLFLGFSARFCW
jgi:hypothetical protein